MLEGAEILRRGGLVAFPTETVYGLGADATSRPAVDAIFEAKQRPADNPVIVHVDGIPAAERVGRLEHPRAERLLRECWPGPLTVVLPALQPVRSAVCRGLDTIAVRMPAHPVALALIRATGGPVAAPSANLSGKPSPTTAEHVLEDLGGRIPLILDGGPCNVGIESTVLDLAGEDVAVLRPGAVTAEHIAGILETPVATAGGTTSARSPGTRYRHYRPRAPVIVLGEGVGDAAAERLLEDARRRSSPQVIGWITHRSERASTAGLRVRSHAHLESLTRGLYADLRALDRDGCVLIFVDAVAAEEPVMERILRASTRVVTGDDARGSSDADLTRLLALAKGPRR